MSMKSATNKKLAPVEPEQDSVTARRLPAVAGVAPIRVSNQLITLTAPSGVEAESIRALRTHVLAQHMQIGRRALAVCAPSEGVGCTFVAANLAVSLAQAGVSTLLIDANMRSPGLDGVLPRAEPGPGLQQFLSDPDVSLESCLVRDAIPKLSLMYAGGQTANAQELLASDRFSALLNVCLRDYDATILDTAPANRFADARRVANVVGYGLVVARRDRTFVKDLKLLVNQLESHHVRVIGTVLNEV